MVFKNGFGEFPQRPDRDIDKDVDEQIITADKKYTN
jgi:hypothetical protein